MSPLPPSNHLAETLRVQCAWVCRPNGIKNKVTLTHIHAHIPRQVWTKYVRMKCAYSVLFISDFSQYFCFMSILIFYLICCCWFFLHFFIGQKTCMHLHGVFPYLYVLYDGSQPLDSYLRRFAASLDKAINVANNSNASTHHVFKITLVTGLWVYRFMKNKHYSD